MFAWLRQIRFSDLSCKAEIFGTISTFFSLLQSYEASITKSNTFAVATAYFSLIHNRNWLVHVHALCCLCLHFASKASSSLPTSSSCSICCVIYNFFSCFEQLFVRFTQFADGPHSFNSDKFRDTTPLNKAKTSDSFLTFLFSNCRYSKESWLSCIGNTQTYSWLAAGCLFSCGFCWFVHPRYL